MFLRKKNFGVISGWFGFIMILMIISGAGCDTTNNSANITTEQKPKTEKTTIETLTTTSLETITSTNNTNIVVKESEEDRTKGLKNAVVSYYSKTYNTKLTYNDIATVTVTRIDASGDYLMGRYKIKDSVFGGTPFYATKINNTWMIVVEGNGVPGCDQFTPYNFPTSIIKGCTDKNGKQMYLNQ